MLVFMRGAGDLASGIALRLFHAGYDIVMSDLPEPTAVRRTVCFSEAIRYGKCKVEDVTGVLAEGVEDIKRILLTGKIRSGAQQVSDLSNNSEALSECRQSLRIDADAESVNKSFEYKDGLPNGRKIAIVIDAGKDTIYGLKPDVIVDAIIAKKNLGTSIHDAPIVIGVGPGFTAGEDCHAVVETKRGHTLGRVILEGSAIANTGVPGIIAGYGIERVLKAPADGIFRTSKQIGDLVKAGDVIADVDGILLQASIDGMLRGLLPDGIKVKKGMKSGDIDPRGADADCRTVSDKSLAVAGGVLEAILRLSGSCI